MIGASAALLMWTNGRIAGVSGIVGGLLEPRAPDKAWRLAFVAGTLAAGAVMVAAWPDALAVGVPRSWWVTLMAGLLVGFGSRLGSGCTSGHGVCGLSRLSPRSLASVLTFMLVAALTVAVTQVLRGGSA